jgi:spermidine synthase
MSSIDGVLYSGKSKYQTVEVLENGCFGRCLVLDGKTQSAQSDEFIYHQSLVQPAMVAHPNPEKVFIAGGGEGATIREVLRHNTVKRAVMVDLDQEVVEVCQKYLPEHHQGAFDDPRLELKFDDASAFLRDTDERFDVIVLDLSDPMDGGPAYLLYTLDFYTMVLDRLAPGGLMVTQSGPASLINQTEVYTAINYTLNQVFPTVAPYSANIQSFGETWGFNIASLGPNPADFTPDEVDARLKQRGIAPMDFYDGVTNQSIFALPAYLRAGIAAETRTITTENPLFIF